MKRIRPAALVLASTLVAFLVPATIGAGDAAGRPPAAAGAPASPGALDLSAEYTETYRWSRPIFQLGQDYTLPANEVVGQVSTVLADAALEGRVERDVVVVVGNARLGAGAAVDGSLVVIAGNAVVEPGATVSRDLLVIGGSLSAPPGFSPGGDYVVVGTPGVGATVKALLPWIMRGLLWGRLIVPGIGWVWVIVGLSLLVYLAVNTLFHESVGTSADAIQTRPLSVFLLGLLVLLLTVPAIVILAATVIGIVIVPFVLCGLVVAGLVGKAAVARAIGRSLLGQSSPESRLAALAAFVLGAALLVVCYLVPVLGVVTWSLTNVLAVGGAAVMLRTKLRREQPVRDTIEEEMLPPPAAAMERPASWTAEPPPAEPAVALVGEPSPAAADPASRATFLDRVAAFALDCLLVGIAVLVLDLSRYDGAFPLLLISYHVAFWAWKGTTLGGIVVGLRVLRQQGTQLRFVDALVRGLSGLFSIAALGIGCFWMLQDPQRQMWHDKIAGTLVLKVPREALLP